MEPDEPCPPYPDDMSPVESRDEKSATSLRLRSPVPYGQHPRAGRPSLIPPPSPPSGFNDNGPQKHPPPHRGMIPDPEMHMQKNDLGPEHDPDNMPPPPTDCKTTTKHVLKVFFSYFGPLLAVIGYMVMGGYLFNYLEEENEILACKNLESKFNSKLNESLERTFSFAQSGLNTTQTREKLESALRTFAKDMFVLGFDPNKDCSLIGTPGHLPDWNVPNAIFFSATIMTTIGELPVWFGWRS